MSQVKVSSIVDASGGTSTSINGYIPTLSNMAGRNRIINGGMVIDQRNAGAAVTPTANTYALDRWFVQVTQASKFSIQQSSTAPTGFNNAALVTSASAYSVLSTDTFNFQQRIEGFNFADLGWGTASAQTITLSFQVRSSLTGTFGGSLRNSAANRSYPFTYTINSANTWETKSVTITGDTSGTWIGATNGIGVIVTFDLGSGSTYSGTAGSWAGANYVSATGATSVVGTSGATFYITGVQLEAGSVATPFERRDYGRELIMCQRYARTIGNGLSGIASATTSVVFNYSFEQPMRASPTATVTDTSILVSDQYVTDITSTSSAITLSNQSSVGGRLGVNGFTGLTQGRFYSPIDNTNGSVFLLSAEL